MKTKTLLKSRALWFVLGALAVAVPLGFHWLTDHRQSEKHCCRQLPIVATTGLDDPDLTDSVIDEVVSSNLDIAVSDTPALFLDGSGAVRGSRSAFDAGMGKDVPGASGRGVRGRA